jgi:hypothetical protein
MSEKVFPRLLSVGLQRSLEDSLEACGSRGCSWRLRHNMSLSSCAEDGDGGNGLRSLDRGRTLPQGQASQSVGRRQ